MGSERASAHAAPWPDAEHSTVDRCRPRKAQIGNIVQAVKAQQMRWNRATVQPFLDVRTAVLNGTLEDAFRQRYPGFRPANDDQALPEPEAA